MFIHDDENGTIETGLRRRSCFPSFVRARKSTFARVLKFARHDSHLARHVSLAWVHVETTIDRCRFFEGGRVELIGVLHGEKEFSRDDTFLLHFITFSLPISSCSKSPSPLPHPPSPRFRSSRARAGSGIARSVGPGATTLADGDGGVQQPGTEPRRWMNRAAVCRVSHTYTRGVHVIDVWKREHACTKARVEATGERRELAWLQSRTRERDGEANRKKNVSVNGPENRRCG